MKTAHLEPTLAAPKTASNAAKQIQTPSDITSAWLSESLGVGLISWFDYARVGTGQVSECYRFDIRYPNSSANGASRMRNPPQSVILKVASQDPLSRQTGISLALYQREVLCYQQIAPLFSANVPYAYHASHDEDSGSFALLLADSPSTKDLDDLAGVTLKQAKSCLKALGNMHGKMLRKGVASYPWLKRELPMNQTLFQTLFDGFVARYRDVLTVEQLGVCSRLVSCYDAYKSQQGKVCVSGMIHGDFRLDNILIDSDTDHVTVIDWQTVQWAPVMGDVAYFLGGSLPQELRRAHFDELLDSYHEALGPDTLSLDRCRSDLRHESFFGLVMLITSCMMVQQTKRGDVMFTTMIKRHCDFILDLGAVELLPVSSQAPPVLQPLFTDEHLHPRGAETLFNESYYFDFVDQEQGIAGYVRLGITPNVAKGGWYLAVLSRRDKPLVSVMDYSAPLADEMLRVCGDGYEANHEATDPLKVFKIGLNSTKAKMHADHASIFRGHSGDGEASLSLNLTFHTDGTPYKYRVATRYEIPCLVDGTIKVNGSEYTISKQVGQRDHSWGVRNWWNMDWFWGGIHLSDGSHIHLIDLYIVGQSQMGIGYYQVPGEEALELGDIDTDWDIDSATNLVTSSTLHFSANGHGKLLCKVEPLGHGPLRLVSDEGKVALFDRAWCKCTMHDGRVGYGWLEWNRVQP